MSDADKEVQDECWLRGAVYRLIEESNRRHEAGEFDPRDVAWLNDTERT